MEIKDINPFDITFGKQPTKFIDRPEIKDEILTSLYSGKQSIYILTGARGSGKTVTLTSIANDIKEKINWIVIDLNPLEDLLEQLAASLYQQGKLRKLFIDKEFSFSFKGVSFTISGKNPVTNVFNLLTIMFEYLKKKKIYILLTIDEVTNNEHMRIFAHSFQSFIRNDYNVSVIMTGLYDNISNLENEKTLTFLYRAPKKYLEPLNLRSIAYSYINQLNMNEDDAIEAAKITKGYAFAYQLIGYILFEKNKKKVDKDVLQELDLLLDERSYSKIWSELTNREKEIVSLIANNKSSNKEILEALNMKSNSLSSYKISLSKKGIIDVSQRGVASFILPRFKEFIQFYEKFN